MTNISPAIFITQRKTDVLFIVAYTCNPPEYISVPDALHPVRFFNEREREWEQKGGILTEKKKERYPTFRKKWKFIETVIQNDGFAHSSTTRMVFGLRKIEFTGKFYTDRVIAFPVLSSF